MRSNQFKAAQLSWLVAVGVWLSPGISQAVSAPGFTLPASQNKQEAETPEKQAEKAYFDGNTALQQGNINEAIAQYREALRLNPQMVVAMVNLGTALTDPRRFAALNSQGKLAALNEAIAQYQSAIKIRPDFAEAHFNLGNAFGNKRQYPEAIASYQEAIRLQPNYAKAYYNLGTVLNAQQKVPEAIAAWKQAITHKPDYVEAYANLGIALYRQGQREEALPALQKARELFVSQGRTAEATRIEQYLQQWYPQVQPAQTSTPN